MIVVEDRLQVLFNLLPVRNGFKPRYHFGDGIEANQWIKQTNNQTWPLIYQTSNSGTYTRNGSLFETNLELILAVETRTDVLNDVRWATTYKNTLRPLLEDVKTVLEKSGIILSNWEYKIENFPKYSETSTREKNAFTAIVDALKITLPCKINSNCITKYIHFDGINNISV